MGDERALADEPARGGRAEWTWALVTTVAVAAVLAEGALKYHSYQDDAFIFFRYVRNWVEGAGLVFNPGQRVEGFTSPSWVALLALVAKAGVGPVTSAGILGTLASAATVLLSVRDARRGGLPLAFAIVAPLALAFDVDFAVWSSSGLETSLFTLTVWGALSSHRLALAQGRSPGLGTGLWLAAAVATRPEGALVAIAITAGQAWAARRDPKRLFAESLRLVAPALLTAAVILVARRWYYGDWLPNTARAKWGGTAMHARLGLAYLGHFLADAPLAFAALLLALPRPRTVPALSTALGLVGLWALHVVRIGGDFFAYHRFLVPLLPLLYALGAAGLAHLASAVRTRWQPPRGGEALAAVVVLGGVLLLGRRPIQFQPQHGFEWTLASAKLGQTLKQALPPDAEIALPHIGAVGYYAGLPIVDLLGLVDRELASRPSRIERLSGPGDIGHDHFDIDFSMRSHPAIVVFSRAYGSRPFTDVSEIPVDFSAEAALLAYLQGHGEYRLESVRIDRRAYWALFVRAGVELDWTASRAGARKIVAACSTSGC